MRSAIRAFVLGALIIGSASTVAAVVGPEYASIVGGVPTGLIMPFFLSSETARREFLRGYLADAVAMAVVLVGLYAALRVPGLGGTELSLAALSVWAVLASAMTYLSQSRR